MEIAIFFNFGIKIKIGGGFLAEQYKKQMTN